MIVDDGEEKEALLVPGETARWKGKEKFVITIGNLSGTRLKLNKREIVLPKSPSNVLRNFVVTRDSVNPQ